MSLNTSTAPIFYCSIIPEKIFQYFNIIKCSFTFLSSWKETQNFKSKHASLYCFPSVLQIFGDELNRSSIKAYADIWAQEDWNIWIFQIAFSQWIAPLIAQLQKYIKIEHEVFRGRSVQRPKRAQMINFLLLWLERPQGKGWRKTLSQFGGIKYFYLDLNSFYFLRWDVKRKAFLWIVFEKTILKYMINQ